MQAIKSSAGWKAAVKAAGADVKLGITSAIHIPGKGTKIVYNATKTTAEAALSPLKTGRNLLAAGKQLPGQMKNSIATKWNVSKTRSVSRALKNKAFGKSPIPKGLASIDDIAVDVGTFKGSVEQLFDEIDIINPGVKKYIERAKQIYEIDPSYVRLVDDAEFAALARGKNMPSNTVAFRTDGGEIILNRSAGHRALLRNLTHEATHVYDFRPIMRGADGKPVLINGKPDKGGLFRGLDRKSMTPEQIWRAELRAKNAELLIDPAYVPFGDWNTYFHRLIEVP